MGTTRIRNRPGPPVPPEPAKPGIGPPPIQLTDADYQRVLLLARTCTEPIIADALLISVATFRRRLKTDPRLVTAFRTGRAEVAQGLGRVLVREALSGDVAAIRYFELTRLGINPTVKLGEDPAMPFSDLTTDQKVERLRAIVTRGGAEVIADISPAPGGKKRRQA